jgi:hypothetical protein
MLTALAADENAIYQRKQNVRRFGAGWIRPPGVAKTLQALKDEELEKEEQEAMARREQIMMDLAAAQQDAANAEARMRGEEADMDEDDDDDENGGEHDLDDDVPEAVNSSDESASASASDSDSDSESESGSDNGASVSAASPDARGSESMPFNEDSFIEGSQLEAEVSAMLEHEEAEMAGVLQDERDLDDDVPEAGSYEHTDSELSDSDSDAGASVTADLRLVTPATARSARSARRSSRRHRRSSGLPSVPPSTQRSGHVHAPARTVGRVLDLGPSLGSGRSSFGFDASSSLMEGSSIVRSSPAAAAAAPRASLRDRFLGVARGAAGRR